MDLNNLSFQELPSRELDIDVDWEEFRKQCVIYYNRWCNISNDVYLKTTDLSLPIEKQIVRVGTDAFFSKQYDPFYNFEFAKGKYDNSTKIVSEQEYKFYTSDLQENHPYVIEVIEKLEKFANLSFSRIRLAGKKRETAGSIHTDFGYARHHIPIVTNPSVLFQISDKLYRMSKYNHLYALPCGQPHSIINGSTRLRLHLLLIDGNQEQNVTTIEQARSEIENVTKVFEDAYSNLDIAEKLLNEPYYNNLLELAKK